MAMLLRLLTRPEHLHLARERRRRRSAVLRIHVAQNDAVVRIAGLLAEGVERLLGIFPFIAIRRRLLRIFDPRRPYRRQFMRRRANRTRLRLLIAFVALVE